MRHVHITVFGQVQGVGFRFHALTMAQQLGIRGWVKNQYDGTVEIEAQGSDGDVAQFLTEVKKGSYHARVDNMMVIELHKSAEYHNFDVR